MILGLGCQALSQLTTRKPGINMAVMVGMAIALFIGGHAATLSQISSTGPVDAAVDSYTEWRTIMVETQIGARGIRDSRVLEAMLRVPRHLFVPSDVREEAYEDYPLPIGERQTISQPYVVALMTEALGLKPGDRVLEVGTGSGYQAAILAAMGCEVYSIEIIEELCKQAGRNLEATGFRNVTVIHGDGYFGLPKRAPFDGIIVTAAPDHVPPQLLEQIKPGGRMVIPVGPEMDIQSLMLITKERNGKIKTKDILPVRFVPLTGEHGKEKTKAATK